MGLKIDKFTWIVILIVVALLAAAVVTVNRGGTQGDESLTYGTDDTPVTPVRNAFVAFQRGDSTMARQQYSQRLLDEMKNDNGYDPFTSVGYINNQNSRRLRILESTMGDGASNTASVTIAVDTYASGGLFGGSNTYSSQRVLQLVREGEQWKIDTPEFFSY